MNRLILFQDALEAAQSLYKSNPSFFPLASVINQLYYLIDLEKGNAGSDQLKNIDIGLVAAREIESFDEKLADILHEVSSEVRMMMFKN